MARAAGAAGRVRKDASPVSTKTSEGIYPGPGPCAEEVALGAGFWKRRAQAAGSQQPPESPAKAGLQLRKPVCAEASQGRRQGRAGTTNVLADGDRAMPVPFSRTSRASLPTDRV